MVPWRKQATWLAVAVAFSVALAVWAHALRVEAQTPQQSVDERQARALEDIAAALRELKRCGCK